MGYTVQWETINNGKAVIKVRLLHRNLPTGSNIKIILIALELFIKRQKNTDSRKVWFLPIMLLDTISNSPNSIDCTL